MIDLPDLKLFVAVADAGGITAAARALESSPPAVSRRLAALGGLSHDGLSFLCDICLLVRRRRLKRIEHCRG